MTTPELEELVALQRFHARHGFGGLPPANIERLRAVRRQHAYLSGDTVPKLVNEAINLWRGMTADWDQSDPEFKRLARERGVHNVPKLLAARARQ